MVATERHLVAVNAVVVSYAAAVKSLSQLPDRELAVLAIERARERALQLLDATAAALPDDGPALDRLVREARQAIQDAPNPR